MDTDTRDVRNASSLPPVSVCLLLAAASVLLLCSRTESAGEPERAAPFAEPSARSSDGPESRFSDAEQRIATWLRQAEREREAGTPGLAVTTLRRAAAAAEKSRIGRGLRVEIEEQLAKSLDASGDHEAAIEVWWRLLSMSSRHEDVARNLAASLEASGRVEEARRVYREMLHGEFMLASTDLGDETASEPVDQPRDAGSSESSSAR